ncbi:hypothetical protein H920_04625 [Fukomys damarensis]|uniref:Uncharacterized protein n=1 Tax=Fukomys damarensis TaxID=885580 RepID=A0A091DPB1_FUKDA|nr:hypothetical protein H920_04625 [Fukomys damarensis]
MAGVLSKLSERIREGQLDAEAREQPAYILTNRILQLNPEMLLTVFPEYKQSGVQVENELRHQDILPHIDYSDLHTVARLGDQEKGSEPDGWGPGELKSLSLPPCKPRAPVAAQTPNLTDLETPRAAGGLQVQWKLWAESPRTLGNGTTAGTGGCEHPNCGLREMLPGNYGDSHILQDHYQLHWYAATPNFQLK